MSDASQPAVPADGDDPHASGVRAGASFLEVHRAEYRLQARWFLLFRVPIVLICLVILLIQEEGSPKIFAGGYITLVVALGVTSLTLLLFRATENAERIVLVAVCLDVVLETALVYLTGGVYNIGFAFLFFATIMAAVLLISERAGFVVASVATVALSSVAVIYWLAHNYEFRPPLVHPDLVGLVDLRWGRITANLIMVVAAFPGVAFLTSRLPSRLSQAHILYDEILEGMGEGVVAIDRRGRILIANAEARRLLNWAGASRLVGRPFEQVLRRREDRAVLEVLARGEHVDAELELAIRGRGRVSVEVRTTVLRDGRGRVRGVVGSFRDLSLRKRLEVMETRLAQLQDTEEIALGIAHEIRNPLGSIRGAVQELASSALTDEADRRLAEIVQRESSRLDRIIQEFLDFARMRPPLQQRLEIGRLVEETAMLLARRPDAGQVAIECDPGQSYPVEGDADQLRQAFLNIGINALQALEGEGTLRFRFERTDLLQRKQKGEARALAALPGVEVTVENDGPPLTEEESKKVFAPFFTTKRQGLGLGMAITQKIVRHHGGDVSCSEGSLGGAAFTVFLPLDVTARIPARHALEEARARQA